MPEWFEEWFGDDYLRLYPHRDEAEARRAVELLRRTLPWATGWRVLDVACGPGRHARALEEAGAWCVGLDLSAALLARARQVTSAPLVRADMRQLPIRPFSMDLTVNLFTSFGYFDDDATHAAALAEMLATVRPGGYFVIDYLNADTVRAGLVPTDEIDEGGVRATVRRALTGSGRFVTKTIHTADGRSYLERVRLFTEADLAAMLAQAGFGVIHRFGDYAGGPLVQGAPRTILMARAG